MGSKHPKKAVIQRLSSLPLLVLLVFVILLISIAAASLFFHLLTTIGILPLIFTYRFSFFFLFLLLISLFVGIVLTIIAGDHFLRPLYDLTEATKEIASGNFSVRVEARGTKEFIMLAESFNEMAKELAGIETLRDDFVNNVSHEFKTPVSSIRGFAKRLKKASLSGEQQSEYLDIIISESERLSKLSENVLLLSRLESAKRYAEQASSYFIDEQIRKVVLLMEPQLQKKHLDMDINLETAEITANEEMLYHLWINLLGNAIKFSHDGGSIGISLKKEEGNAVVSISDTGAGMDDEVKKHLFDKFYQGDVARATEGNGLGLSIVKKILELENGKITLDSTPDAGTCFTVLLPAGAPYG